ncbi:MAG TPA: hypothetical protein VF789_23055 [Thermoanaerobaculia bacterium]
MSKKPPSPPPAATRPLAPHVQAAMVRTAQAKPGPGPAPARPQQPPPQQRPAAHVQAACRTVQAKPATGVTPPAPRVVPVRLPLIQPRIVPVPVIQRASRSKEDLEKAFMDALSRGADDEADELEKLMSAMPGDTAQTFGTDEEDAYDLTYKGKQLRFGWPKGLRQKLMLAQTKFGKLYCALGVNCYVAKSTGSDEIVLNKNGKEEWISKGGNKHETAPPIDHYSPDWKDRLSAVEKKGYDVKTFATKAYEAYIAVPLRIIHMVCNSKRNGG